MTPEEEKTYCVLVNIPETVVMLGLSTFILTGLSFSLHRANEIGFYMVMITSVLFLWISAINIYRPYQWILMDREVAKKNGKR